MDIRKFFGGAPKNPPPPQRSVSASASSVPKNAGDESKADPKKRKHVVSSDSEDDPDLVKKPSSKKKTGTAAATTPKKQQDDVAAGSAASDGASKKKKKASPPKKPATKSESKKETPAKAEQDKEAPKAKDKEKEETPKAKEKEKEKKTPKVKEKEKEKETPKPKEKEKDTPKAKEAAKGTPKAKEAPKTKKEPSKETPKAEETPNVLPKPHPIEKEKEKKVSPTKAAETPTKRKQRVLTNTNSVESIDEAPSLSALPAKTAKPSASSGSILNKADSRSGFSTEEDQALQQKAKSKSVTAQKKKAKSSAVILEDSKSGAETEEDPTLLKKAITSSVVPSRPPTTTTPSSLKTASTATQTEPNGGTPQKKKKGAYTELPDLDAIPPAGPSAAVPQPPKPKITAVPSVSAGAGGGGGGGRRWMGPGGFQHSVTPPNKGMKEVPEGAPNCLVGKVFAVTGVLDSLEREEAIALIEKYGGKVLASGVGKSTTHLVAGLEAGEGKLRKAEAQGVKVIDEDGLFELIRNEKEKAAPKAKKPSPKKKAVITVTPAGSGDGGGIGSMEADENTLWTDKYKPQKSEEICGNTGMVQRLKGWLAGWHPKVLHRAALLSGPPGIGKTTAAHLVAKECGYKAIEFNASDTRSKKAIVEHVASMCGMPSLHCFFAKKTDDGSDTEAPKPEDGVSKNAVLIMDEVDGMSGGDRGGIRELIQLIKNTKIPIICICNDHASPKVKSLANYCEDIRFRRPQVAQVLSRIEAICKREKLLEPTGALSAPGVLNRIIAASNGDVRQVLNMLQTTARKPAASRLNAQEVTDLLGTTRKEADLSPWAVVPLLFSCSGSLSERLDLYFVDSGLVPLMISENYPKVRMAGIADLAKHRKVDTMSLELSRLVQASESISASDLISKSIMSEQHWDLMPLHAAMSTVRPASAVRGSLTEMIGFPQLLGKTSTTNKRYRLLKELQAHMSLRVSANKSEVGLDYAPMLKTKLTQPLIDRGAEGVAEVVELMEQYGLTREDIDTIMELTTWGDAADPMAQIPATVKSALTRTFNAGHHHLHSAPFQAAKAANVLYTTEAEEQDQEAEKAAEIDPDEEQAQEVDVKKDKLIVMGGGKAKKAAKGPARKKPKKE